MLSFVRIFTNKKKRKKDNGLKYRVAAQLKTHSGIESCCATKNKTRLSGSLLLIVLNKIAQGRVEERTQWRMGRDE